MFERPLWWIGKAIGLRYYFAFITVQFLDLITTFLAQKNPNAIEANPIIAFLLTTDPDMLIAFKYLGTLAIIFFLAFWEHVFLTRLKTQKLANKIFIGELKILLACYSFFIVNNIWIALACY